MTFSRATDDSHGDINHSAQSPSISRRGMSFLVRMLQPLSTHRSSLAYKYESRIALQSLAVSQVLPPLILDFYSS